MEEFKKDRITAAATPALIIATAYISNWFTFLMPIILYFVYKGISLRLSQNVALKVLDLTLSMTIFGGVIGLIIGSLRIVATDMNLTIPLISSNALVLCFSILGAIYCLASLVFLSIKALKGKEHNPKLSMGIIEALRGKRTASSN